MKTSLEIIRKLLEVEEQHKESLYVDIEAPAVLFKDFKGFDEDWNEVENTEFDRHVVDLVEAILADSPAELHVEINYTSEDI